MLQTRWGGIAAQISRQNARSAARGVNGTPGYQISLARASATVRRVHHARSRVSSVPHTRADAVGHSASFKGHGFPPKSFVAGPINGPALRSAFPTKTVIFLVVLSAAAYYLVEIKEEDWADHVLASFSGDPAATPLHFFKDREEVDHWLQQHIPDPSAPLKHPEVLRQISDQFPKIAFGWEIQENESREFEIPVTHGIRFRSNEPCVSFSISYCRRVSCISQRKAPYELSSTLANNF